MQPIELMGTTRRHSELVDGFSYVLTGKRINGELNVWSDTVALIHDQHQLINVNEMSRVEERKFVLTMNKYPYVEPDIMSFQKNVYVDNFKGTRIAGCPDLVIEIWSDSNEEGERQKKFSIYSSSPLTEHWYLDQDKDIVKCYQGKKRLPDQHLLQILKTQEGWEFDLRYLATLDDTSWNSFINYGFKG